MAEATRWFVILHDEPADGLLRPEFERWRLADERHAAAYARLQRLWGASGHLPALSKPSAAIDRRGLIRSAAGVGAAVVVVAGAGRLILGAHPFADYRTRAGERSTVVLADGSRIDLSTATMLSVELSERRRRVRLLQGEAWFQVAPDAARPFVVEAAGGRTTALGTAFAVAMRGRGAEVSVTEHAVRVEAGGDRQALAEGRGLDYDRGGLGVQREVDMLTLDWREGRLAFIDQPLGKVAAALDRWTGARTVVLDRALAARRVTLTLATQDAGLGLERLAQATPLRITRLGRALSVLEVM